MKSTTLKKWIWIHRWSSLVGMVFMLMLCLTGLPLIFAHELDHWLGNTAEAPPMAEETPHASIDELVRAAERDSGGHAVRFLVEDPDDSDVWYFNMGESVDAADLSDFVGYDARTATQLSEYPLDGGIVGILLRLHVDLFAGIYGMLFLGLMGVLMLLAIVSGVVIYAPFMRRLDFGEIRARRARRTQWLDMHNLFGAVTMVWLAAVSLTGVINTLSIPVFEAWKATQLDEMKAPYADAKPVSALDASAELAVRSAQASEPDMTLSFMAFPGNSFASPAHFVAFMRGNTPWRSKFFRPLLIDARTGAVVEKRDLPWFAAVLLLSQPLHFGDYGGMPLKILWALLDILSIIVLSSGLYLWAVKKPAAAKPVKQSNVVEPQPELAELSRESA
ncbi:MAG: PepSY domain-containing protein [Myxococcota bacterium]